MADWALTKGLQNLRSQVNARWPGRDHASDGTISDAAHRSESSTGHSPDDTAGSNPTWDGDPDNIPEVRAFDMDSDLREPGTTAQMVVDHIRALPGVSSVLRFMIYNHKMYHEQDGWKPTAYNGASGHEEHIHFEGARTQAADNNTTFDFKLDQVGDDDMTPAQMTAWAKSKDGRDALSGALLGANLGDSGPTVGVSLQSGAWRNTNSLVASMLNVTKALAVENAEVPPSTQEIVEAFRTVLGTGSVAETVAALKAVLGSNAAEVGRALAAD